MASAVLEVDLDRPDQMCEREIMANFLKWLYKKQQAIFAKKIAKFAHLAGDGKDKYVRALVIGFDDIDVDVDVTEIPQEQYGGSKKFTDDEFKQLLDDCNVKHR